ncbi:MAG: hypothetical protein KGN36_12260 [Acidobacteriota bacterium]|nr:hypothetical protein [Acidobacteriota bacterium]
MGWIAIAALWAISAQAADLKPAAVEAFRQYTRQTEQRLSGAKTFLWADEGADRARRIRAGEILVQPFTGKPDVEVAGDCLIHDWVGSVFIPGATVQQTLALVEDYNHHKDIYKPEVVDSRLVSREGNHFHIYLRLLKKKVITVQLNTEHDVDYTELAPTRWSSASRSTRIVEVDNPGKPDEREIPPGDGHGFLWRLNSYWRFEERDGGTWVECEAVSLTRDVPTGLGWLIEPIVRNLPKESLENTLRATRAALTSK